MEKKKFVLPEITVIEILRDEIISTSGIDVNADPNVSDIMDQSGAFNLFD